MKVAKWGNSLAVRVPAALVLELGLKEGDEIQVVRNPDGALAISSSDFDQRRREAIESMRAPNRRNSAFNSKLFFDLLEQGETQSNDQGSAVGRP
jgi:antitoxin MazE